MKNENCEEEVTENLEIPGPWTPTDILLTSLMPLCCAPSAKYRKNCEVHSLDEILDPLLYLVIHETDFCPESEPDSRTSSGPPSYMQYLWSC